MIELFQHLLHLDFNWIVKEYQSAIYVVLFLVIFIETGLVVMPFLPGDSLLFTAGLFAAPSLTGGTSDLNILILLPLLFVAAVLGDNLNYWVGQKLGLGIFNWKFRGKQIVKKEYLDKTELFFEKNGTKAIIMARFVPIVRTFTPFAAGVGKMNYKRFFFFDLFGGFLWIFSLTLAGYFLGNVPWIKENIEKVCLGIIFISILPMILSFIKSKKESKHA